MAETELHAVRVPDELWRKALARARREGTTLSVLIRDWLTEYVAAEDDASVHDELHTIMARLNRLAKRLDSNQQPFGLKR